MITGIISTLLGMFGGVVPDLLKEYKDARQHKRELEFLQKNHEFQMERAKAEAEGKIKAAEVEQEIASDNAHRDLMVSIIEAQAKPTGIMWIDAFNAILRPGTCAVIITIFALNGLGLLGVLDAVTYATLYTEMVWAVLGFLFGYRATAKK